MIAPVPTQPPPNKLSGSFVGQTLLLLKSLEIRTTFCENVLKLLRDFVVSRLRGFPSDFGFRISVFFRVSAFGLRIFGFMRRLISKFPFRGIQHWSLEFLAAIAIALPALS